MSDVQASATSALEQDGGLAETVSEQATMVKEKGRRELRDQLDERTSQLGQQARSLAETLRRAGIEAKTRGSEDGVERITSSAADRLERAGGYLERASGDEMLRDAEQFVRTRPWVVAGAAAAAGLLASRIFKASSERRFDESTNKSKTTSSLPTGPISGTAGRASVGGRPGVATGQAS